VNYSSLAEQVLDIQENEVGFKAQYGQSNSIHESCRLQIDHLRLKVACDHSLRRQEKWKHESAEVNENTH